MMTLSSRVKKLMEKTISRSYMQGYMYCFGFLGAIFVYKIWRRIPSFMDDPKIPEQSFQRYVQIQKEAGKEI